MKATLRITFHDDDDAENFASVYSGYTWEANSRVTVTVPTNVIPQILNDLKNVYGVTSAKIIDIRQ